MAEENVKVSEEVSVGDEDLGASAEAHAGTTVGGVDMEADASVEATAGAHVGAEITDTGR